MSRRSHDKRLVRDAHAMRANGYSYGRIARALGIGESTVRDWVRYYTRIAA